MPDTSDQLIDEIIATLRMNVGLIPFDKAMECDRLISKLNAAYQEFLDQDFREEIEREERV